MPKIMVTTTVRVEVDVDTWNATYGTAGLTQARADVREHVPALVRNAVHTQLSAVGNGAELMHDGSDRVSVSRFYP